MIQNRFDQKAMVTQAVKTQDEIVLSFVECMEKARNNETRRKNIEDIREDKQITASMFARLPCLANDPDYFNSSRPMPPQMKASGYFQIKRKFNLKGLKLPKVTPRKVGERDLDNAYVEEVLNFVKDEGKYDQAYNDCFDAFFDEGTAVMEIGYENDKICYEMSHWHEWYFDPSGYESKRINGNKRKGKGVKWAIREVEYEYSDFLDFLKKIGKSDLKNKVQPGGVLDKEFKNGELTTESRSFGEIKKTDPVCVYTGYSITGEKPTMCLFGGANGQVIKKYEGKEYPFWKIDHKGKKVEPFLPFELFHFSDHILGLKSLSMNGILKDGEESLKKILNNFLPNIAMANAPFHFLLGINDSVTLEKMMEYRDLQQLGVSPIITSSEQGQIQTIAPQSTYQAFTEARRTILDEQMRRTGINFAEMSSESELTATEFLGKSKQDIKSISEQAGKNKYTFEVVDELSLNLVKAYWSPTDDRSLYLKISDGDIEEIETDISLELVLPVINAWDGTFDADTDLTVPMSAQDIRQARQTVQAGIQNIIAGIPFQTKEEITPSINLLNEEISDFNLQHVVSKKDLDKMVNSLLKSRGSTVGKGEVQTPETAGINPSNPEAMPQAMLAEAGIT